MAAQLHGVLSKLGARALQTRWIVRAPIGVYRAGLGRIFGSRLLMLEHVGRTTGARRYVVLEVVGNQDLHRRLRSCSGVTSMTG